MSPIDVQPTFTELNPVSIGSTITQLKRRIEARFPGSGLSRVAGELVQLAEATKEVLRQLRRPLWWLRGLIGIALAAVAAIVHLGSRAVGARGEEWIGRIRRRPAGR